MVTTLCKLCSAKNGAVAFSVRCCAETRTLRFEAGGAFAIRRPMFGRAPYASPVASQLKRWLLNRRRASVQRLAAAAPVRRCRAPAERVDGTCTVYTPHPAPISRAKRTGSFANQKGSGYEPSRGD